MHSAAVWHSSLTEDNINGLNRVQKSATQFIMGRDNIDYETELTEFNMENLEVRISNRCRKLLSKHVNYNKKSMNISSQEGHKKTQY